MLMIEATIAITTIRMRLFRWSLRSTTGSNDTGNRVYSLMLIERYENAMATKMVSWPVWI